VSIGSVIKCFLVEIIAFLIVAVRVLSYHDALWRYNKAVYKRRRYNPSGRLCRYLWSAEPDSLFGEASENDYRGGLGCGIRDC
jgi:hypothetical protein